LNLGIRFDHLNVKLDSQDAPAGTYVAARHSDEIDDVPDWKDISPRLGFSWDVFGNGKTAIKTSLSRYIQSQTGAYAGSVNPITASSDTRTWTDANRDGVPQLSELGPSTNLNFGKPAVVTFPSDDVRLGWQKRPYNWEYAASVQHTLMPGLALNVGFFRRKFG